MGRSSTTHTPQVSPNHSTQRLDMEADLLLEHCKDLDQIDDKLKVINDYFLAHLDTVQKQEWQELTRLLEATQKDSELTQSLAQDAVLTMTLSENRMFLTMSIEPHRGVGKPLELQDILKWLKGRKIQRGVDLKAIQNAVVKAAKNCPVQNLIVVRGKEAVRGKDGQIKIYARQDMEASPTEMGPNTSPAAAQLCHKGDCIASLIPPTVGQPGYDAMGKILPALPGKVAVVEVGPNVIRHRHDYLTTVDGQIVYEPPRLSVVPILILRNDVTPRNSPIRFEGDIHVFGSVRNNSILCATGNIDVRGSVEAAQITSTRKSIRLHHGVVGHHRALIRAKRDIRTHFSEHATLIAGRDIHIDMGTMHSHLISGRDIHISQGRGRMVGGTAAAGEIIRVNRLGAMGNDRTEISVGLAPATIKKLDQLNTEHCAKHARIEQFTEVADKIHRAIGDPLKLPPQTLAHYIQLRKAIVLYRYQLTEMAARKTQILQNNPFHPRARVDILNQILPGVVIHINNAKMENQQTHGPCTIRYEQHRKRIIMQRLR